DAIIDIIVGNITNEVNRHCELIRIAELLVNAVVVVDHCTAKRALTRSFVNHVGSAGSTKCFLWLKGVVEVEVDASEEVRRRTININRDTSEDERIHRRKKNACWLG